MLLNYGVGEDSRESARFPREGNGYPLQYSCLENSMDSGAWQATAHVVAESDTTEQLMYCYVMYLDTWEM